jgi:hypothetical protein
MLLLGCLVISIFLITNISGKESKKIAKKSAYISQYYSKKSANCDIKNKNDACAIISIHYPFFVSALGTRSADQLNHYLEKNHIIVKNADDSNVIGVVNYAQKFIDDYLDYIKDDQGTSGYWEQSKKIHVVFINEKVLSLQDDEDGYTGGAHGFSTTHLSSLNLKTGKVLELNDILLKNKHKKLVRIAEQHFRKLHNLSGKESLEQAGFDFDKNHFALSKNFAVLKKGIMFYYNSYEIAAYVVGATQLFIPYEALVGVVDTQSIDR